MTPEYCKQASTQTLRAGLLEYQATFASELTLRMCSKEGELFFRCHDVVHVVFGCGLALEDELVVKISSFFGTNGGAAVIRGYRLPESKEIYATLSPIDVLTTTVRSLWLVPRTLARCWRMRERWPWLGYEDYLDVPLADIRARFRIRVAG